MNSSMTRTESLHLDAFWLRALCMLACVPSAGALLLKVYGVMPMQTAILYLYLPCVVFLTGVWLAGAGGRYKPVREAISIGILAGLLATFAYDLTRVPFLLFGQRVFMTINTYGVWISDAGQSSRFTDVIGWAYHFSNGIAFGIMYALFMRGRHWLWAVVYACLLETIALSSPFRPIFSLSGNWQAIGILYLGHVAYGIPLGLLCQHWDASRRWLEGIGRPVILGFWGLFVLALAHPIIAPDDVARDKRRTHGELTVEGKRLNPDFLRIRHGEHAVFGNPTAEAVSVLIKNRNERIRVPAGGVTSRVFPDQGIYQVLVETDGRTRSSFVIVEDVEDLAY